MRKIICIGNRYVPNDDAGYRVFSRLKERDLDEDIQVLDGGLGGLDLLRLVEGASSVVFVDNVDGFGEKTTLLRSEEVAALADGTFSHEAGLPYLLRVLPDVCDGPLPSIKIVGIEKNASERVIDEAAQLAVTSCHSGDA